VGAAQNEYFLHINFLYGSVTGRPIRAFLLLKKRSYQPFSSTGEKKNKRRTKDLSIFVFNMMMAPCEMRTNKVQNGHRELHCLCGFNNLKVVPDGTKFFASCRGQSSG
jgi:hypothetical protein